MLMDIDLPSLPLVLRVCVGVCVYVCVTRPTCRFDEPSCQYCVICKCEEFSGRDVGGAKPC